MARANLPAVRSALNPTGKDPLDGLTPLQKRAVELLGEGWDFNELARKLSRGDKPAYRRWRSWLRNNRWRAVHHAHAESQLVMQMGLAKASAALVRRAERGRPDAIKLLFEATGLHNARVKHEHSGEISVKLEGLPRPPRVDADIPDADVVED